MAGVSDAAANWHTYMPPIGTYRPFSLSQTFCAVGIFQSYQTETMAVGDWNTRASQFCDAPTVLTELTEVETHEEYPEPVFKHLDRIIPRPLLPSLHGNAEDSSPS